MATSRALGGCRALMAAAGKSSAAPKVTAAEAAAAKSNRGILKPVPVSAELRKFVGGAPEVSRAEAIKKVWDHIKAHDLQNPANKREINCDEKLKSIFPGKDKVGMMEIAKLLSTHFMKSK